jgi:alpha-glucosidase
MAKAINLSSAAADVLLFTPPNSKVSLVEYRIIGGIFDFYFFSGPSPQNVIEQYGELISFPSLMPSWAFGFHLCRFVVHRSILYDEIKGQS